MNRKKDSRNFSKSSAYTRSGCSSGSCSLFSFTMTSCSSARQKTLRTFFFMSDHRWVLAFHLVFDFPHLHWIFFLAMLLGILTGALSCRFRIVGEFLEPPIQFMKSIPVASFVILALIWTGSKKTFRS